MRKINKGSEPEELTAWKRKNTANSKYDDLSYHEREAIRQACIQEQYYLCAYCCCRIQISENHRKAVIEHVQSRSNHPNRTLDFSNLVLSCPRKQTCDSTKKSSELKITPLEDSCETDFIYEFSGKVGGANADASEAIEILSLNSIKQERKLAIDALIFGLGESPDDIELLDSDLFPILLEDLLETDSGKLLPYSPILRSIITALSA